MEKTCCFIGHRKLEETPELVMRLEELIEFLILNEGIETFLFGSRSQFDTLCLSLVTRAKEKHPHIKRIYVRAEFPDISEHYELYLKIFYDSSYFPERLRRAGRAAYVERNREMVNRSRICVVYSTGSPGGTEQACRYAAQKGRRVINLV